MTKKASEKEGAGIVYKPLTPEELESRYGWVGFADRVRRVQKCVRDLARAADRLTRQMDKAEGSLRPPNTKRGRP